MGRGMWGGVEAMAWKPESQSLKDDLARNEEACGLCCHADRKSLRLGFMFHYYGPEILLWAS